jgi:hypothetical protein
VQHSADVRMITLCGITESPIGDRPADGPLLDAWFELNDRLQEEANEIPRRKQRGIQCHSVLDTESSLPLWIPASAGITVNAAIRGE